MTDPNRYRDPLSGEAQADLDTQLPFSGMPNADGVAVPQQEQKENSDIKALHHAEAQMYDEQQEQDDGADQLAAMRRASSITPEYAAYCDKLSADLDVPFNAVAHDKEAARKEADVPAWQQIAKFAPKTSALLQEKPEVFHQVQDDAAALKDLEVFKSELKKNGVTDDEYNAATKTIFDPAESIKAELNKSLETGTPYVMPSRQNSAFFTNLDALGTQFNESAIQSDIGMRSLFNDMQESLGVISPDEALANRDNLTLEYKDSALRSSEATPSFEYTLFPKTNEYVFGAASSLVQSAPVMAVGLLNPLAGVLVAGAQTTTTAYPKYSSRGGSKAEALLGAGTEGLIEVVTEKIPLGFAAEHLGKMSIKNFAKQFLGKEMVGEQIATFGQDLTDTLIANPNKTMAEFWQERPEAAVQTMFAVGMNTAAMASIQHIANTVMKYDGSYEANQKLNQEMEIVKKLKVAGLNTIRAKQILDNMDGDSLQDVYVDPQQLFNQGEISPQQFKNAMPNYSAQLDEALAVGGLLRMDKNELMLAMRNDEEGWASLSQHLKVDPAADSLYESAQSRDALTDELNKLADKRIAESKNEAEARDQWDALKEKARQRLADSGMDKEAIEQAATMDASVAHAFSTRTGLDAGDILSGQFGKVSRQLSDGSVVGGVFNQYAGEQALNADLTALQRAKQAVDSGADPEQIRQETGWHKGLDSRWRFEIDDSASNIRFGDVTHARMKEIAGDWITTDNFLSQYPDTQEAASMRLVGSMRGAIGEDRKLSKSNAPMLDEVLDHPALFAAYPDLAAVRVVIDDSMPIGEAAYIPESDVILLSPVADNAQKKSLLLHEVQHAIQEREGFARGGSSDEFMSPESNDLAARKQKANQKISEINAKLKTAIGEEYQRLLSERSALVKDAQIDVIDINELAHDQYTRLAGEVEARDTQERAGMSAEERKQNKPYISQGIPDDQVIVRKGSGGLRSSAENDAAKYNADAAPTELSDEAADDLVTLYQELGSDDDSFQYARETSDDLDADIISALPEGTVQTADEAVIMAAQMDAEDAGAPDIVDVKKYSIPTKELLVDGNDKPILKDGKKQYSTQKRDAYVYINDAGEYWTDLSDLKRSGGVGGIIYTKVADFAEKNGGVFRGDPLGLSDDALLKRTEHMASGIARRKDTARFIPHERQLNLVDKDHANSPLNTRARAMTWVKGNDTINRREIVKTAFHNITQVMPELRHAWIDPDTGRILVRGTPLNAEFDAWVHELQTLDNAQDGQRGAGQSGSVAKQREPLAAYRHLYASASIKRQLLANTLARYVGESAERRRQILDRLGEISKDLESYDGRKLFYQSEKTEPSAGKESDRARIAKRDAEYMAAVERGDMETAQKLVNEVAAEAGYDPSTSERMSHAAPNSTDGFSVSLDKIRESGMVPDDYWTHPHYYTNDSRERSAHYDVRDLFRRLDRKKSGEKVTTKITVYRSIPKNTKDTKLRNGDWVSTNRSYAVEEGLSIPGGYRIVSEKVEAASLYWDGNSIAELGFDNGKGYAYKNTKNNRKLLDAIVRDYDGNIVPLSKRFNSRKTEEFYQNDTSPRGTFDPVTRDITMLPGSDLSTYLHESGHLYLEVMASLAGHETASEGLRTDMDAALKWFGVEGENASERLAAWNAMTLEEKRNFHEKWAESFEQYLFEGKAPSAELREAFKNFRQWLTHVYKSMAQFLVGQKNAKLNDEMRGVFDRILASEEQINTMREARNMLPIFTVRPANITNDEWERYQQAAKDFAEESIEQLTSRSLRDMKWLSNAKNKTLRKLQMEAAQARRESRMEARTAVLGQPVYRAWQFLTAPVEGVKARNKRARNSEHVDTARDSLFTAIAKLGGLNKEEAVSQYGIDPKDFLRKGGVFGKPVLRKEGGLSPDAMAEALSQFNYLPLDEHGKWDILDLEDLLREEAAGNPQYSTDVDMDVLLGEPQRAFFDAENVEYMGGRLNRIDIRNMFDDIQLAEMAGIDPFSGEKVADSAVLQGYNQKRKVEGGGNERQYVLFDEPGNDNAADKKRAGRKGAPRNMESAERVPGRYTTTVKSEKTKEINAGFDLLDTPAKVAFATSSLSKSPQEVLFAVATDKNDKPIAILRHSLGMRNSASVDPGIVAGWAANVEGAAYIWLSHNHPSGKSDLSNADKNISKIIGDILDGTGITNRGIIAVTHEGNYSWVDTSGSDETGSIPEPEKNKKVSVVEREFSSNGLLSDDYSDGVNNPADAIKMAKDIGGGEAGIVMLDAQYRPIGFMPINYTEANNARGKKLHKDIVRAIELSNANAVLHYSPDSGRAVEDGMLNIGALMDVANIQTIDAIVGGNTSLAGRDGILSSNTFQQNKKKKNKDPNAPRTLESMGVLSGQLQQPAFHGSPYKFDKFSLEHIGKGEGAQAYGWGLYFAGNKEVAEYYRETLAIGKGGNNFRQMAVDALAAEGVSVDDDSALTVFQRFAMEMTGKGGKPASYARKVQNASAPMRAYDTAAIGRALQTYAEAENKGQLYKVEIPEDDTYLLWDKPLSEQPEKVLVALGVKDSKKVADLKKQLKKAAGNVFNGGDDISGLFSDNEHTAEMDRISLLIQQEPNGVLRDRGFDEAQIAKMIRDDVSGESLYTWISGIKGQEYGSKILHSYGLNGIKYLDGSSRGAGDGNYNYVIFDDSAVKILETYYQLGDKDQPQSRTLESMGVLSDDGIQPDLLADYFGFPSVEAMVKSLLTAPDPLSEINRLTDEIMVQRHADLATPQAIEQAALAALHSEAHSKFLATELAILNRAVGKPRFVMQAAKQYADRIVSALRIADLNPAQYEMQAAKAGKETEKLLGQNKTADAAMAKRNQILHDATARRVREEKESVAKALRFFDRTEKAARNGKLRADVGAQVLTLLDSYDLRKGTTLKAAELADRSLAEFVQQQSESMDMPMPSLADAVLRGGVKRSYKTMSVEEFNGLVDAVKYLEAVGRREYAMYKAVRDQSFAQERSAILDRLREYWPDAFDEEGNPLPTENAILKTGVYNAKKKARSAVHELLTPETVTNILEGGEFGQVHDSLFARLSNAMTDRSILMKELHEKLQPFMDAYTWKERREFGKKDIGTAAIGEPLSRENALVAALLAGSKEGRDRLANYGWNDARIAQVVNLLDAKDIALANAIFDMFDNTLWPKLEALNKRTMGVSPPKVLPIALQAKNGTLTGGYFPIRYDGDMDARSSSFDDKQALDMMKNGIGLSAKTNQSSSQARVDGVKMRPLLSLSVMSKVAGETAHDISLREAVMDSARLLNNAEIAQGIQNIVGMEGWKSLKKNLGDIASPPHEAGGMFASAANFARRNVVTALMSGVGTAVQNFTGLLPAFSRVHKGLLLKEIADVPHLIEKYKDTIEKSAYMRGRFGQFERDLVKDVDRLSMKKGFMPDPAVWFAMMAWVDRAVSVPVWQAAYREGVAKGVDAVEYADHIVRQTQGGGRLIDRAPIMRGGALQQLFTMFYSYFNGQLNLVARDAALAKREVAQGEASKAAARLAASAIFVWILPAVVSELTRQAPDDEDDEEKLQRVVRATILYPAAMIPLLRDFAPFVYDKIAGNRAFDPRLTPVQGFVSTLSRAATAAGDIGSDDFDEKDFKALMMGVGFTFNLPAILFTDVVLGTKALLNGETDDIRAPLIGTAPSR